MSFIKKLSISLFSLCSFTSNAAPQPEPSLNTYLQEQKTPNTKQPQS